MTQQPVGAELRFDGKVAVVTGAGGGLGRAHAMLLADRGASVVVNDLNPAGTAAAVANDISEAGGCAVADTNTVATAAGGAALVATALDAFGRVDIVVNNAAIISRSAFADLSPGLIEPLLDVAVRGAINVTQPAWRLMIEQGYGRIIMTSSNAGWIGSPEYSHYGTAKLGLVGLTKCLAQEATALDAAGCNIRVNALGPRAATPMQSGRPSSAPGARSDAANLPPGLVSPVVAWLAHDSCEVNGEFFAASGGRVARIFFGLTPGYWHAELTPEQVRDHVAEICAEPGYVVPRAIADEVAHMLREPRR